MKLSPMTRNLSQAKTLLHRSQTQKIALVRHRQQTVFKNPVSQVRQKPQTSQQLLPLSEP